MGCNLNIDVFERQVNDWYGEGDDMIFVDGEPWPPRLHGTGTEDYFHGAWYFTHGCFSAPFHGLTLFDKVNSRVSAYRFHVPDAIPFEEEIRVTIEHGHDNMLQEDYSSVAYWYQEEPHDPGFGRIPEDAGYLAPLRSNAQGYLMTEVVADPIENIERRKILHEAAILRLELRQVTARGMVPPELEGLTEMEFMSADFEGLRKIVEEVRRRRSG